LIFSFFSGRWVRVRVAVVAVMVVVEDQTHPPPTTRRIRLHFATMVVEVVGDRTPS
jgi:hypothetical protein